MHPSIGADVSREVEISAAVTADYTAVVVTEDFPQQVHRLSLCQISDGSNASNRHVLCTQEGELFDTSESILETCLAE